MAIHTRVKFDSTSTTLLLPSATGFKYEIYGWSFDNNGSGYVDMRVSIALVKVAGLVSLYGVYNSGAGAVSYAGVWQMPISTTSPYFEVEEGKNLFVTPNGVRLSGALWYEKVSTAQTSVNTINALSLLGIT